MGNVTEKTGFCDFFEKSGEKGSDVFPFPLSLSVCFYFIDHVFDVYEVIVSAVILEVFAIAD